jgi:murein L,D-transpeptidase YcbB/YkuD
VRMVFSKRKQVDRFSGNASRYSIEGTLRLGATALLWATLFIPFTCVFASNMTGRVSDILQDRLRAPTKLASIFCRKELLCGPSVVLRFYARRAFRPAWSSDGGPLPQAAALIGEIHRADRDGLGPEDYHLAGIEAVWDEIYNGPAINGSLEPELLADLDLLLTDAFLLYGSHLLAGRVNPETIQSEWSIESREADLAEILQRAVDAGEIGEALENLRPRHRGYQALTQALSQYRDIMRDGGWPGVPHGPTIREGDQGPRVSALRSDLIARGDLQGSTARDLDLFDGALELAVKRFQRRHGLAADGVVGPATLRALNVPVEKRIRQIKCNMERWRWLPKDLGQRYIMVNIANFRLDFVEDEATTMTMRVVVGRRYRRTPVFTGTMTYMELNPYWHVPPNIAKQDLLPRIREDPGYLGRQKIRVFQGWEAQAPELDPESIAWSQITAENFSFKLLQEPGPKNALGPVKFMFPNKFNVYLHGTPAQDLFQRITRTFSSGCIRVEKPIVLAAYLLRDDPQWSYESIRVALDSGETQIIRLLQPSAVHLLYWTAWVDSDGVLHFRDDIYRRDTRLDRALNERPPAS